MKHLLVLVLVLLAIPLVFADTLNYGRNPGFQMVSAPQELGITTISEFAALVNQGLPEEGPRCSIFYKLSDSWQWMVHVEGVPLNDYEVDGTSMIFMYCDPELERSSITVETVEPLPTTATYTLQAGYNSFAVPFNLNPREDFGQRIYDQIGEQGLICAYTMIYKNANYYLYNTDRDSSVIFLPGRGYYLLCAYEGSYEPVDTFDITLTAE
jgi:hypothetical protein